MKKDSEIALFDALTGDYVAAVLIRLSKDPADDAYEGKMNVRGLFALQVQAVLTAMEQMLGRASAKYGPETTRLITEPFGRVLCKYGYGKGEAQE